MLTYNLISDESKNVPMYELLYEQLKADIISRKLHADEHLPSKRSFAGQLGISVITVEHAYEQLISEGYVYTLPKQGYFVADLSEAMNVLPDNMAQDATRKTTTTTSTKTKKLKVNLSNNNTDPERFPFNTWAKLMREHLSNNQEELLQSIPGHGLYELRKAISNHLYSFRNMDIDPERIIIGSGTESLYHMLILLLGKNKRYAVEDPGFQKIGKVYSSHGVKVEYISLDNQGLNVNELSDSKADILHISPTHHYPTGITMPISRRYELLSWASQAPDRYIIEDDYDSEFRLTGRTIPSLQSIDVSEKVIYINTFSKSLTPNIRVSYMVLPEHLMNRFKNELGFFSTTVSSFEQFTLAAFMEKGYFEKQINRMRLHYARQRKQILSLLAESPLKNNYKIIERDSGLHFLIELNTDQSDEQIKEILEKQGIGINSLKEYYHHVPTKDLHQFILNYSNLSIDNFKWALKKIAGTL